MRAFQWALVLGLCLVVPLPAFAQGGTAEINGTVMDQGKAVLPGATVTAINEGTGQERQAVTGGEGRFVIPTLTPGTYTVKAELSGFETVARTGLVLQVGQELAVSLTLNLAGVKEDITVTAQAPLVETTSSKIGTNITSNEIDNLPAANRSQFSLMQTIPGLVPALQPGSFEGGQFNANGQATTNNLFLVDGQYDNDSRLGGSQGTQARITLDSMAEYQVQTHQYGAEYGGSTGVVVNTVSRSGSNKFAGRAFGYLQSNKLQATDYFLKQAGEENPTSGNKVVGGSLGGPLVQNKMFFFANLEYDTDRQAANLSFPAIAAPLAVSYSTTTNFTGPNHFLRWDYQVNGNNSVKLSWLRERILTVRDSIENNLSTLDNATNENDSGDQVISFNWTSVLNNRTTNEFKVGHVRENLLQGPAALFSKTDKTGAFFDGGWHFVGFEDRDAFDVGSQNSHPDYNASNRNNYSQNQVRDLTVDDTMTWIKSGWGGEHTFKGGVGFTRDGTRPSGTAANFIGNFGFSTDKPFNAADPSTYPRQFTIAMGQYNYVVTDRRVGTYFQDKWVIGRKLTLNMGVRYDWQKAVPLTKNAIGPRIGMAYDATGDGKTLIRGGYGKVFQYQQLPILITLAQRAVIAPTFAYDTTQLGAAADPANTGAFPVGPNPNATACLNPVAGPTAGEAVMSPACRAFLVTQRAAVAAGGVINNTTTGPIIDGDRKMAYTHAFSVGVKRELVQNMAFSVDYVGNRGRNNTAVIDINEAETLTAAGKVQRLGQAVFNPNNVLGLPAAALAPTFWAAGVAATAGVGDQFNQEQTLSSLNTKFNSLEVELEKRYSNRWSGRVSYTYGKCFDVGAIILDKHPEYDYGRCDRDNTHAFATSANVDLGKGLGAGFVFRKYSGNPINETIGSDFNSDRTNNDRPTQNVNDLATLPSGLPGTIVSAVDSRGVAVRNGILGQKKAILDARFQYVHRISRYQAGLFLEIYNVTNHANFGNPTGARNSVNFLKTIVADDPRTAQLGIRLVF